MSSFMTLGTQVVRDQTTEEIDRKIADQVLRSGVRSVDATREPCAKIGEPNV